MVQNGPKWSRIVPNLSKIVQKGLIQFNMIQKNSKKNHPNGSGITRSPGIVVKSKHQKDANLAFHSIFLLYGVSTNFPVVWSIFKWDVSP